MARQNLPYILLMAVTTIVAVGIAIYTWRRRRVTGGAVFALTMLVVAFWAFTNGGELASLTLTSKIWWSKFSYFSTATIAPVWFIFALTYGRHAAWLTRGRMAALWVGPLLVLALVFTNEWHMWFWSSFTPTSDVPGSIYIYGHGWAFWITVVYSYPMLIAATVLLVRAALFSGQLYRQQVAALLAAAAIPWISNIIYIANLSPVPGLELTPLAFTLSGLLVTWAIFRYHIFELLPVARDVLVESMDEGVVVLDANNHLVDINPAACRLLERTSARVVGQTIEQVFYRWPDLLVHCQTMERVHAEFKVGRGRWIDLMVTPLKNQGSHGQLSGRLLVLREITERKENESRLQAYTQELEARNAELDAFAHTVAHDLKNPLSIVTGYGSMMLDHRDKIIPEQYDYMLSTVVKTSHRMTNIIDELLLLSSVRKTEAIKTASVDMAACVAAAQERLQDMIRETEAHVITPKEWPVVRSYKPWLEEVWVNYISNAIKYGGKPLQITLGYDQLPADSQNGARVSFWVKDNGAGLSPDQQDSLFVEFSRLDEMHAEGHGLGLSIVRRIIEKLSGEVGVESTIGQGSKFYFVLPIEPIAR